ncbi:AzlD domain-containing protein [Nitrogeniibacter aestuarii]|uniref:AzlD domain-containing protein n=1 Tax=Nitrogeniibacter aestuarii TaxID=2815343 RepID=UPI001D11D09C|nr:AzlD domain-containing protein [Nitrogeniibacter aestuarii]
MDGLWFWLALVVAALATHGPRGSFIVLGRRARMPAGVQDALRFAPAAALAAVIAPSVFVAGHEVVIVSPKLLAAIAVIGVTLRWRNPWLPFAVGMAVLLTLTKGFGL